MANETKQTEKKKIEKLVIDKIQSESKDSLSFKSDSDKKPEKTIDKKEKKKTEEKNPKKNEAVVNAKNISISKKYAVYICNFIRGKDIGQAIAELEEVLRFERAIPMKGEIPHRKGKIMSGRYPINAVKEFIKLLKSLRANAIANELEIEKYVIFCKTDVAPKVYRRFGRTKFKRSHVTLKLIQPIKTKEEKITHNNQ